MKHSTLARRMLTLQRKQSPRPKRPPGLPHELRKATIWELPAKAQELLEDTHMNLREDLVERLVWAIKSDDDDIKSRAWVSLVSLGRAAIPAIAEQLMERTRDITYRVRLVRVLAEIGEKHREAMVPLIQLLSSTKVPEVLNAARAALISCTNAQATVLSGLAHSFGEKSSGLALRNMNECPDAYSRNVTTVAATED